MPVPGPVSWAHAVAGNKKATVSWAPVSGAGSYRVTAVDTVSGTVSTTTADSSTTSVSIGSLTNGRHYFFGVSAHNSSGYGATVNSNTVTPQAETVPDMPNNVKATAGNKTATVRWSKPDSNGGATITNYIIKTRNSTTHDTLKQTSVAGTVFSVSIDKLTNDDGYEFAVIAVNKVGNSSPDVSNVVVPSASGPVVAVSITSIGPDKIANTRPGQSLPDAPKLLVKGTNLAQSWARGTDTQLQWILYTDTTFSTTVGTDSVSTYIEPNSLSATSFSISSPVAPSGAHVDSNGLIGPWRLQAKYIPDPGVPTAQVVAYSPKFYTTAVGSMIIGAISPNPVSDGVTVTMSGAGIGNVVKAICDIGGNTKMAPTTKVDGSTVTFTLPTFGYQLAASGTISGEYHLNGNILTTDQFNVNWVVPGGDSDISDGSTYTPPTAADVPPGEQVWPIPIQRWIFTDPGTGETYTVPRNPDAMTSPFPTRNVTTKYTTAISGQMLFMEGSPSPAQWQFSGTVVDAKHYEQLRHWVNDINSRVQIRDHYGRIITCLLLQFDPVPNRDIHRYWATKYQITALVVNVDVPTVVPSA